MAVPLKSRSTVTVLQEIIDNVAVIVAVPPSSAMFSGAISSATVGAGSSSVMVAMACCVPASVPLVTVSMSTMIVSLGSSHWSGTAVNVTVPVRLPAGITICVSEGV